MFRRTLAGGEAADVPPAGGVAVADGARMVASRSPADGATNVSLSGAYPPLAATCCTTACGGEYAALAPASMRSVMAARYAADSFVVLTLSVEISAEVSRKLHSDGNCIIVDNGTVPTVVIASPGCMSDVEPAPAAAPAMKLGRRRCRWEGVVSATEA